MSKSVLIIEDSNEIRENVSEILILAGYTVFDTNNGKVGVELATTHFPDIILCDIMMPELDGYGVLYMLNKNPKTSSIPFIFLTAKAERVDLRKGMEMGADDYLTKPFDDMELLNAIESRLSKKEAEKQFYSKSLDQFNKIVSKKNGLAELKKVLLERKARLFKAGQVIYYDGDKNNELYLVISGKVKTIKMEEDGRELMTGIYLADDYLGINVVLANEPYADTATALEDSLLCLIPKNQLDELINLYPDVAKEFIKLLSRNIKEKEEQLLQMAYHSVRKKMAETIVRLFQKNTDPTSSLKVSREDLAALAGMASETVSRTLTDFKDEGLIERRGSTITLLDIGRLTKMKN